MAFFIVVTRYYGGVKLGTGGLVRAYSGMVKEILETLPVKRKITGINQVLVLDYNSLTTVKTVIASLEGEILQETFTDKVTITVPI